MKTALAFAYPHITTEPRVMSGRPCISGTRVRVMDVVGAYRAGISDDQLQEYFSSQPLTLSEIHAALAYYNDHRERIDAAFAKDEALGLQAERELARASR